MLTSFCGLLEVTVDSHAGKPENSGLNHDADFVNSAMGFWDLSQLVASAMEAERRKLASTYMARRIPKGNGLRRLQDKAA